MLVLEGQNGMGNLHLTGRDLPECVYTLGFDAGKWSISGQFDQPPTQEQKVVLDAMGRIQIGAAALQHSVS